MASSTDRRTRSTTPRGSGRARNLSRFYRGKSLEVKSVFAYVKGIPLASNIPSIRSKEETREGKDKSSGEQLQPNMKKGQSVDSYF